MIIRSEPQCLFRTSLNASGAFDAVRIVENLVNRKLHRTDLLALAAVDAQRFIHFELIFFAAHRSLQRSHRAEGAPCPRSYDCAKEDGNRRGNDAEGYKDHSDFVHHTICLYYSIDHEAHEKDKDDGPQLHAPELCRYLYLPAQWAQPEVNKAAPRTEISAEPAASKRCNDHEACKYNQEKEAQFWIKYATYRYN